MPSWLPWPASCRGSRDRGNPTDTAPAFRCSLLIAATVLASTPPAFAKILTTRPTASSGWVTNSLAQERFTIGSGFEIQSDSDEVQYDFPFLIEYNFTETLNLTIEPDIVYIESKNPRNRSVTGFNDLETTLEWEFLSERRYRPAFSVQGAIKWPTATDPDIGTPKIDYSLGLVASKDLVLADLDLNLIYTFIGDCHMQNLIELSIAAEWPVNHYLSVLTEVVTTFGSGGVRGATGTLTGLGNGNANNESEGLIGLAEQLNKFLKFEQGIIRKSDQSWQFVFAWEYAFGGD